MIKLIACDLDETLLGHDGKIVAKNIELIAKARAQGVYFVIATGRGFCTVQGTLAEIGLNDKENEYVISFNGGALTENKNNRVIYYDGIGFERASELYRRGLDYDVCIHAYTQTQVFVRNFVPSERLYLSSRMTVTEIENDNIDFLKGENIVKCVYMNEDRSYLQYIANELGDITQDMDISYSSNRYLEFNNRGVNKGSGLKRLADILNVSMENTMAIGDNLNDISMIKAAGMGVAVANATQEVKDSADFITSMTFNDGAVAEAIERFVLL